MGIVTALAIAVHNFPEGIATFISALDSAKVGIAVAAAVAVHNIPEGIAVSVPIYFSTGSRKKAFWYSLCVGAGRTGRGGIRLSFADAFPDARADGVHVRRGRGYHGLYFAR